jgi:hypothetical protein
MYSDGQCSRASNIMGVCELGEVYVVTCDLLYVL